jgi:hypothetical protein
LSTKATIGSWIDRSDVCVLLLAENNIFHQGVVAVGLLVAKFAASLICEGKTMRLPKLNAELETRLLSYNFKLDAVNWARKMARAPKTSRRFPHQNPTVDHQNPRQVHS